MKYALSCEIIFESATEDDVAIIKVMLENLLPSVIDQQISGAIVSVSPKVSIYVDGTTQDNNSDGE